MSAELVLLSIIFPILILVSIAIAYLFFLFYKQRDKLTDKIVNKLTKNTAGKKEQREMDELVNRDITSLLQHPAMLDIFPESVQQTLQNPEKNIPSFLTSLGNAAGGGLFNVFRQGADGKLEVSMQGLLQYLPDILNVWQEMRKQAKERLQTTPRTTKQVKTTSSQAIKIEGLD